MIEIRNVCAGYDKQNIIRDISCEIKEGQITALLGPNGCGKTTLLRVISGLKKPNAGTVLLNGQDLYRMHSGEIARKIACLPQDRSIPSMTAGQLVLHGRFPYLRYPRVYTAEDRRIALACMEETGTAAYADKMLNELSGGQRQSVYLAMMLAQQAGILLLDEPAAWMDTAHRFRLYSMLKSLKEQGKCMIIVMHDLPEALSCSDRILLMQDGQLIMDGTPEEILESRKADDVFGISLRQAETADGPLYYCIPKGDTP